MVAVQAPTRREAIVHAELEVKKAAKLPASYQILGRVVHECALEEEARRFMDLLHEQIEKEKEADAEGNNQVQGL